MLMGFLLWDTARLVAFTFAQTEGEGIDPDQNPPWLFDRSSEPIDRTLHDRAGWLPH
jgi:hypothetical protein